MDTKKILKYTGLGILLLIIIAVVAAGFVFFDVMSYSATASEKLNPSGSEVGKALVVYDPGISGASKNVASEIAQNLQAKGYAVDLAGISSTTAKNTSGYNVIVVGGPVYAGNASTSIKSYLNTLKVDNDAKIGVFATGSDADVLKNRDLLFKEVAPLPQNDTLKIVTVTKVINANETNQKAAEFVNALLK
ncbi:MAG: flavodoxin family protein [Methanobacterium sp.]